jgi:phosphoribosylglycinamide formyltransferase-1
MNKIVIFASGSGTNAEKVIEYLNKSVEKKVSLVFSNKKTAGVIARSERLNVPVYVFDRADFYETGKVGELLEKEDPDLIVLAGFLWLVPGEMIKKYKGRIINIHPALLPKYGGKGMYGMHVHKAVIENNEKESGISIHYVNENYDEGDIIFQARCKVEPNDTPESLAERIHLLEHRYFPEVISDLLDKNEMPKIKNA